MLETRHSRQPGDEYKYSPIVRMAKLKAFKTDAEAFDTGKWFQAVVARVFHGTVNTAAEDYCHRRGMEITNVGYESSGTTGGYLVPSPLAATIIAIREEVGVAQEVL